MSIVFDRSTGRGFASVIVCAHNHLEDLTVPCLDHVLQGTSYPHELILVDDGSRDSTIRYFQTMTAKAFRNAKRIGVTKSRNIGLMNAEGHLLVFIDNDVFVTPGWLSILEQESQKAGIGIVGGVPSNEKDRLRKRPAPDMLIDFPHVSSACMAITRRCFRVVGYLDETLTNSADTDYCYRAGLRGFRVASTPRLVVPHLVGGTRRGLDKKEIEIAARRFRRKYIRYQDSLPMPPLFPFG